MGELIYILECPESLKPLTDIFAIISEVVNILKIAVPIILIILGMLDFGKAVMASKEDDIKKAQGMFVKRCIYAVAIFFVVTIVSLLTNLIVDYIQSNEKYGDGLPSAVDWIDCIDL